MKFTVGYQLQESGTFVREILRRKEHIYEVYFAWGDLPSGRGGTLSHSRLPAHEALLRQAEELRLFSESGIALNLLLNANCYGAESLSRQHLTETGDLVDYLKERFGLSSVTTASPVLAHFVRANFPDTEVRASVNMEIGTVEGMEYLAEDFDGFYYKRELNLNLCQVAVLKKWCDENGKKLYMLANSGCLNFCSARTFHDNLVAHEKEIMRRDNGTVFRSACSRFLERPENKLKILQHMNAVRPEEMAAFEPYVTAAKLATRVSPRPENILKAYCEGSFRGNFLDLTEPSHSGSFYPMMLDNSKLPADFSRVRAACPGDCESCGYCESAYQSAAVTLPETAVFRNEA